MGEQGNRRRRRRKRVLWEWSGAWGHDEREGEKEREKRKRNHCALGECRRQRSYGTISIHRDTRGHTERDTNTSEQTTALTDVGERKKQRRKRKERDTHTHQQNRGGKKREREVLYRGEAQLPL